MEIIPNNLNHIWAALMMEELYRCGVRTICIAPGSRSTPLTWNAAEHPELETVVHFDERGLAFHALGIAKSSGHPVAIVCTSGSAVANLLPAVVEASMSHVPLILLTSDRPYELIDCGANQSIRQPSIFGEYTRWESNLPCPTAKISGQTVLSTIDHALSRATGQNPGPVHLNCPYREPLAPNADGTDGPKYLESLERWRETDVPWTQYHRDGRSERIDLGDAAEIIEKTCFGLLVVGQLKSILDLETVRQLADSLGWPVVADIASGARLGQYVPHLVSYADQLLQGETRAMFTHLETVIHIGGALVSKRVQALFESHPPDHYIRISLSPERLDPAHLATHRFEYHENLFHTIARLNTSRADVEWRNELVAASGKVDAFLTDQLSGDALSEPGVMRTVTKSASELSALFLGNSMPIRDADMYGVSTGSPTWVHANRGASGIDGNIATAAGLALGAQHNGVTAVLGDLAALHDLNSLALLKTNKVVLVIINNGGGGIFSFLPVADHSDLVEKYFNTPHTLGFKDAAGMFGIDYVGPDSMADFINAYDAARAADHSTIIEIRTHRDENVTLHRKLEQDLINHMKP